MPVLPTACIRFAQDGILGGAKEDLKVYEYPTIFKTPLQHGQRVLVKVASNPTSVSVAIVTTKHAPTHADRISDGLIIGVVDTSVYDAMRAQTERRARLNKYMRRREKELIVEQRWEAMASVDAAAASALSEYKEIAAMERASIPESVRKFFAPTTHDDDD